MQSAKFSFDFLKKGNIISMREVKMKKIKFLEIGIIVFWAVMMGLLVNKHNPVFKNSKDSLKKVSLSEEEIERETWMGIYLNEKKIGYSHFSISRTKLDGQDVYRVSDETYMKMKYTGQTYDASVNAEAYLKKNFAPISFSMNIFTEVYRVEITGKARGNKIEVLVNSGGTPVRKTFPAPSSYYLPIGLDMMLAKQKLEIGKPYRVNLFDPELLSGNDYMTVTLKKTEKIGPETVMVIEKSYKNMLTTSWINTDGELLREESPLGLKLVREPKEIAFAKDKIQAGEFVKQSSIASNTFIPAARSLSYLRVKMRGLRNFKIPSGSWQSVSETGGVVIVEVHSQDDPFDSGESQETEKPSREYTMPSMFIQSNEPEIVTRAVEITEDDTLPWERAKHLERWVFENLQKVPTFSLPSAVNVLKEKRGDCNEHATLLVSLCRAVKIPSRICIGLVYLPPSGFTIKEGDKGSFFYHAWAEVFINNRWKMLDPTFGQEKVDATHIKLLDGDMDKQVAIIGLIGTLKLKVEDFR